MSTSLSTSAPEDSIVSVNHAINLCMPWVCVAPDCQRRALDRPSDRRPPLGCAEHWFRVRRFTKERYETARTLPGMKSVIDQIIIEMTNGV